MARCHICNSRLVEVEFDDQGRIEPCDECISAVQEVTAEDATCDLLIELGYTLDHDDEL